MHLDRCACQIIKIIIPKQVFGSCEKTVESVICWMWSWSNNELLNGILSIYQYLLDKLLSIFQVIFFFPGCINLSGDLVMVALKQIPSQGAQMHFVLGCFHRGAEFLPRGRERSFCPVPLVCSAEQLCSKEGRKKTSANCENWELQQLSNYFKSTWSKSW